MDKFKNRFNFKGYRTEFPAGLKSMIALILTHDDGTSGNYLIVEVDGVPYAAIPIVDKQGLAKMIEVLQDMHKNAFNNG